jgi:hypothetical protein
MGAGSFVWNSAEMGGMTMSRRLVPAAIATVVSFFASTALAQCGCGAVQTAYAPVASSYAAYYPPTMTYHAPTSQVTYAPVAPVTYYAPVTPRVTYYAPAAPAYGTYYAAPVVQPYATYYAPVVQPTVVYYGAVGTSIYGTPRLYLPGQPVRNVLRAVTP